MLTCLLLLLPENSSQTILLSRNSISAILLLSKSYIYAILKGRARTFVKIHCSQDKQIKQVNSYFDCRTFMTIYDILSIFIATQVNFITSLHFMTFYDFMNVWELCIYKRTFWKNTHQFSFFQYSNCIPGASRSSGHPAIFVISNFPTTKRRSFELFLKFERKSVLLLKFYPMTEILKPQFCRYF